MKLHNKAWDLLDEKGLSMGEKMMVRSAFIDWSGFKTENPFINSYKDESADNQYFHSTHELIKHLLFEKEEEVVLANAIYLNMDESNGTDEFIDMFKFTCRVIGLNSAWA